jgi:hypothetical protein
MRKTALIVFGMFIAISSCQKEPEMETSNPTLIKKASNLLHFSCFPPSGDGYPCGEGSGCYSPGFACLAEVTVGAAHQDLSDELNDLIDAGNVTSFFEDESKVEALFPDIDENLLDSLQSGSQQLWRSRSAEKHFYMVQDPETIE